MELDELSQRLVPFCQAHLDDPGVRVENVEKAPGHAGFSYFFDAVTKGRRERFFLRLPPPNVRYVGIADVLRQATILKALDGTDVPHAPVLWSGDDEQWFGRPYFVVPRLDGDVLRAPPEDWHAALPAETRRWMSQQVMRALANIHKLDWEAKCPSLGPPVPFDEDVTRWDRLFERAEEAHYLRKWPEVRQKLLDTIPGDTRVGVFHGDFQWSNLLFARDGTLLAVIDWELVGIGATLNDVGWIVTFNDPSAWAHPGGGGNGLMGAPDDFVEMYIEAYGSDPGDINWYRALAAYKFASISGFNLMLHRRGKRPDPAWEDMAPSMESLMEYALRMLG